MDPRHAEALVAKVCFWSLPQVPLLAPRPSLIDRLGPAARAEVANGREG